MIKLTPAETAEHFEIAKGLLRRYAEILPEEECRFEHLADEIERCDQMYAPPGGRIILAENDGAQVGCVGVKALDKTTCEMKRMFVLTETRGKGVGRRLALEIIAEAKRLGFKRMRLDTLESMTDALALYRSLGFKVIEPYYESPTGGKVYMEINL